MYGPPKTRLCYHGFVEFVSSIVKIRCAVGSYIWKNCPNILIMDREEILFIYGNLLFTFSLLFILNSYFETSQIYSIRPIFIFYFSKFNPFLSSPTFFRSSLFFSDFSLESGNYIVLIQKVTINISKKVHKLYRCQFFYP